MPKFRQAMETSHSDSPSLLPASTIKVSRPLKQNQLIKKLDQKEPKLFPYYLITCLQQLCIVKIYAMLFHQGTSAIQVSIKVRLMKQNVLLALDTFLPLYKTPPQTCERLRGRLQRDILTYAYWVAHELY